MLSVLVLREGQYPHSGVEDCSLEGDAAVSFDSYQSFG